VRLAGGTSIDAVAVIVATPAITAVSQCTALGGPLASLLARIPFGSCATVSLAFRDKTLGAAVSGHGYLRPRADRGSALAVTWVSQKWAHRAPDEGALVRVFLDGAHAERDDDATLVAAARAELATAGVTAVPRFARVRRWMHGMPLYAPGHRTLLGEISRATAQLPGLALAGNSYDGVGIPDAIRSAHSACAAILAHAARQAVS
jgi:oxygen-dependent protoporphyrinogen oxidase